MAVVRHFTATGFVVYDDKVALHWHKKVKAWLPPGGHIEDNEDPVQTVIREVKEEAGLHAEVVQTGPVFVLDYPAQVTPPVTIMIEDINDPVRGYHQHIDLIYVCRLVGPPDSLDGEWLWVSRNQLENRVNLSRDGGPPESPPEDVCVLALHAFAMLEKFH